MCETCPLLAGVRAAVGDEVRAALAEVERREPAGGPLLLTVAQASAMLALSRSATYALLDAGEIEAVKIGTSRRVVAASLEAFIERQVEAAAGHLPVADAPRQVRKRR